MIISPGARLKDRLKKSTLIVPGAYDALSALLIEKAGFEAIYVSGAGLSAGYLGKPDIGLLTLDEVVSQVRRITSVVQKPVLVDVDTGFGGTLNVMRTVQELERAGAAGIQIEDQEFPKRCGHLGEKTVISIEEMVKKIKAAKIARKDPNFLIIARTDVRGVGPFQGVIQRCQAYHRAGADLIFPEALRSVREFEVLGRKKTVGTLMANMTEFGISPRLTAKQLARLGYRLVLFPMTPFRVAAKAMEKALALLKKQGTQGWLLKNMQTREELYKLIGYDRYNSKENHWRSRKERLVR